MIFRAVTTALKSCDGIPRTSKMMAFSLIVSRMYCEWTKEHKTSNRKALSSRKIKVEDDRDERTLKRMAQVNRRVKVCSWYSIIM